jgi:hypothetical protein
MPDRNVLKIGDRITLLRVPAGDLEQREREVRAGAKLARWTADTIEGILARDPVVTISVVDEYGPWFEYDLPDFDGHLEHHSIMIMEDDSWSIAPPVG